LSQKNKKKEKKKRKEKHTVGTFTYITTYIPKNNITSSKGANHLLIMKKLKK